MNILYSREATGTLDEIGARLEKAAAAHQFGVLGIVDIKEKMVSKGVDFEPACKIYEVCNPHRAKSVLTANMAISTALPCRISVYEEGGKIMLSTILPGQMLNMFQSPDLQPVAEAVEKDIKAIIDDAAGGD